MKIKQKIKNSLVYLFVRFMIILFNIISRSWAQKLGGYLGEVAYTFLEKDKRTAHKTLSIVYEDRLTTLEKEAIIKAFFINSGKNLADLVRFKRKFKDEILPLIKVEGIEYFDKAYDRGKGVIGITGHIGNFELLAAYMAQSGYKAAAIGREMYDKRLDKILVGNRKAMGVVNVDTKDSPRILLRLIKEGYVIGVLIDTDSGRVKTEFVPAFGKLARTPVGQSILGLKTGAAFVPVACVREENGYKIIFKPEIIPERSDNFENDLYNITARCTEALDEIIDKYREQWIWIHNRWRTVPPDDVELKNDNRGADK